MLTRVVADDELEQEAEAIGCSSWRSGARLSQAYVRKLLLASAGNDLDAQMALEGQLLARCAASPDGREGIQAFFDKRVPKFQ